MAEIKQVVNEFDWMHAIYEYIESQLRGRFRLQFPGLEEAIDDLVESMNDPLIRSSEDAMRMGLWNTVSAHGTRLTVHSINGCPHEEKHEFQKEFINMVWSARRDTHKWLTEQGIVPGQSCN